MEEIHDEFEKETEWSKELFGAKLKFLQNMWEVISSLEEEMDDAPEFDSQICRDVLKNVNNVIRKMCGKASTSMLSMDDQEYSGKETKLPEF